MPCLILTRAEAAGDLPPFCVCCGAAAEHYRTRTFWYSPAVYLSFITGPLMFLLLALTARRVPVCLPFCKRHRAHWVKRSLIVWGGYWLLLAGPVFVMLLRFTLGREQMRAMDAQFEAAMGIGLVALSGFSFFSWVLVWPHLALGLQGTAVRPLLWIGEGTVLSGLSARFVAAYQAEKEDEPEALPSSRPRLAAISNDCAPDIRLPARAWD